MSHVLSLISNPDQPALTDDLTNHVEEIIADAAEPSKGPVWLAPRTACEWLIEGADPIALREKIRSALSNEPIDVNCLPNRERRKKLLLADMDSTMIEQECLDEIAGYAGFKDQVAKITERAMAGELEFEPALRERVALLKNLKTSVLEDVFRDKISLMPGGPTLVKTMGTNGATAILVSGGFTFFTSRIAQACGFHHHFANELLSNGMELTGKVKEPILGKQAKKDTLDRFISELNISPAQSMAVGDGANDKDMLIASGLGVALHGKPILRQAADATVDYGDLTALLYLQGYKQTEFAT